MKRLVPTLLAILAVLGLLLPPTQVVHAHDDGHDAHSHGVAEAVHVALPAHSHPHLPVVPVVQVNVDVDSDEGNVPEPHAHLTGAHEAIAQHRGNGPVIDGWGTASIALAPTPGSCLVSWPVRPEGVALEEGRDVPRCRSRSMDLLIVLGRLLI